MAPQEIPSPALGLWASCGRDLVEEGCAGQGADLGAGLRPCRLALSPVLGTLLQSPLSVHEIVIAQDVERLKR